MTKIVIYSESSLDGFCEQTLQYLHDKYHSHPSGLRGVKTTQAQREEMSYNDAQGRGAADVLTDADFEMGAAQHR